MSASEPTGPDRVVKTANGFEIHFYDGEVIEDEEGMKKVMAWAAAQKAAEAQATEAEKAATGDTKQADPDRPAA